MNTTMPKSSASINIDAGMLGQIQEEAGRANKTLSDYLESLLYRLGYRPYNKETIQACREAREEPSAGVVDTSSMEAFVSSILGEEGEEDEAH